MAFDSAAATKQFKNFSTSGSALKVMAIAGAIGGVAGFALSEIIQNSENPTFFGCDPEFCTSSDVIKQTAVWFMLVILGVGLLLSSTQGIREKNVEKTKSNVFTALPGLIFGGLIAGGIAEKVYQSMLENSESYVIPRTIAWGIAGGLGGLAVGVGFRSATRLRNSALGGLGGGLLGGLLFDQISTGDSAAQARFIGIVLIGLLMGLFIGLLDAASTDFYLEIVSGEAKGFQFVLFDQSSIIGCARTVAVTLTKDPLITEQHVKATKNASGLTIECLRNSSPVLLNGQPTQNGSLPVGGSLQIGNTVLVLGRKKGSGSQAQSFGSNAGSASSFSQNQPVVPIAQSAPVAPPSGSRTRPSIQMPNKPKQ